MANCVCIYVKVSNSNRIKRVNRNTRCVEKITYVRFSPFFCYVGTHVSYTYVDNVSHFGLSVCFLTDKKVTRVLVCSSLF